MNHSQLPFEKLKGRENFSSWKVGIKAHLITKGLWQYTTVTINDETKNEDKVKGEKALAEIILSIDSSLYSHVESCDTAMDGWKTLTSAFEDTGVIRRYALLKQWVTLKLDNCSSMQEYVNQSLTLRSKVKSAGFNIDDEVAGAFMLCGLSEEFKPMVMSIETNGQKITMDYVKNILLQEIEFDKDESEKVFTAKKFSKFKKHYKNETKSIKCYKCGGPHYRNNCPNKKKPNSVLYSSFMVSQPSSSDWYIDSGATAHMISDDSLLVNKSRPLVDEVTAANKSKIQITSSGIIHQKVLVNGNVNKITMTNVQCVPEICVNLISVSQIVKKNNVVVFSKEGVKILDSLNNIVASGTLVDNMFKLDIPKNNTLIANSTNNNANKKNCIDMHLMHRRLGHVGMHKLVQLFKTTFNPNKFQCDICIKGKKSREPFKNIGCRSSKPLELVHSDICGPITPSLGGSRYFITFIDDFSRKFKQIAENQSGHFIKTLRTDNGLEYVNKQFNEFLKKNGIVHQRSAPYSPQQNGLAERMNRTLLDRVRCMLIDSNLTKDFWAEALLTATKIVNTVPCKGTGEICPDEVWFGKQPDLSILRIFGCKAFAHIPKIKRKKLDDKATECIFIGYAIDCKAYKLYDPNSKKVIISRDVTFIENSEKVNEKMNTKNLISIQNNDTADYESGEEEEPLSSDDFLIQQNQNPRTENNAEGNVKVEEAFETASEDSQPTEETDLTNDDSLWKPDDSLENTIIERREPSARNTNRPKPNYACVANTKSDPSNVKEAISGESKEQWENAMRKEMNSLTNNETWTLAELPKDKKAIKCKWVFKTKINADEGTIRYKARLVAKGFTQVEGVDYDQTFSPVVRYTSIRFLLAMAVKCDLRITQMDVVTAFLHSKLDTEIYMQQPEMFDDGTRRYCKLNKSIYGLKQSSRLWNAAITEVLNNFGLQQSRTDQCIFHSVHDRDILIVAIYVDDLLILSNNLNLENQLKSELQNHFKMKDLGDASSILGIRITRDKNTGSITIDQSQYVQRIIQRFGMADSNSTTTPMDLGNKLSTEMSPQTEEEKYEMRNIPYREATGSLQFAAQVTRPDICYVTNFLSRYNENPGKSHWIALKRVLRYLKGTINYGITYKKSTKLMQGYCDSDWASCLDTRRSTTGYVFIMQEGAISWNSKIQKTVALSTSEAEFMSMVEAMQEATWLKELENELTPNASKGILIHCDNVGAIRLALNNSYSSRTKHIDIKAKYISETAQKRQIKLAQVSTENMPADILTKGLAKPKMLKFLTAFGITQN